ncbi:unnamed protein product [Effrenium voratum]|uniref:Pentatricopeptide repeat-containing protein, chloroplastic n=1 Tax=Effrenium voratum TaxID=2562239 RepID=A0AA36MH20_9DINO|nr:unnamed protein product [Effrenium voratum]
MLARTRCVGQPVLASLLSSCHKETLWQEVLVLLESMWSQRLQVGTSLNRAISSCASAAQWQLALALAERGSVDPVGGRAALAALAAGHQWQRALQLLQLDDSATALGAAVAACARAGRWAVAVALCRQARPAQLNHAVLSAAVSACGQAAQWETALELLREGRARAVDVGSAMSAVIAACRRRQRWIEALALFQDFNTGDSMSLNATLSALERGLQWHRALFLLSTKLEQADIRSFNAVISGCIRGH